MVKITQAKLYSPGNHFDFRARVWSISPLWMPQSPFTGLRSNCQQLAHFCHVANRKPRRVLGPRPLFLPPLPYSATNTRLLSSLKEKRRVWGGGVRLEPTDLASHAQVSGFLSNTMPPSWGSSSLSKALLKLIESMSQLIEWFRKEGWIPAQHLLAIRLWASHSKIAVFLSTGRLLIMIITSKRLGGKKYQDLVLRFCTNTWRLCLYDTKTTKYKVGKNLLTILFGRWSKWAQRIFQEWWKCSKIGLWH